MTSKTTLNIGVNVSSDGSMKRETKDAAALGDQLKRVGDEAAKASKALTGLRGVPNTREPNAAPNTGAAGATTSKIKQASTPISDQADYRTARGIGGVTGAAGRDFAKQAQGLGGLVHVYATFAANVFAVSAAFNALKNAADTTNMIKGLDQLGAASGRNLGQLSKQVAVLTDGAVSLRESMTAVAQASSAGMSSENIKKMTIGAKNASAALGIGMGDALSRLSRGISKIEPELLDELGIFVRVDKASRDYASSLGKSVTSLTDLEKRAGFAKAVLEQLDEKFGAMETVANPFSQLTASLANLLQTGLEIVNKVLGPIAKFMAESPTAMIAGLATIVGLLAKMALPTFLDAKGRAAENLDRTRRAAKELGDTYAEAFVLRAAAHEEAMKKEVAGEYKKIKTIAALRADPSSSIGKKLANIESLSDKEVGKLRSSMLGELTKSETALTAAKTSGAKAAQQAAAASKKAIEAEIKAVDALIAKRQQLLVATNATTDIVNDSPNASSLEARAKERIAKRAEKGLKQSEVLNSTFSNTEKYGVSIAWEKMQQDIRDKNMSGWNKWSTQVKGAFSIATSAIGTMMNAFGPWMAVFGLIMAGVGAFVSYMSTNAKQVAAFEDRINTTTDAVDALDRAMKLAGKTGGFSITSINARATAFEELAASARTAVDAFRDIYAASSVVDKALDGMWGSINKGHAGKLNETLAKTLSISISNIPEGPARKAYEEKLSKILPKAKNIRSITELKDALNSLTEADRVAVYHELNKAMEEQSVIASKTARALVGVKDSFTQLGKLASESLAKLTPTDDLGKMGAAMISSATTLGTALESPLDSLLAIQEITKNPATISLFDRETQEMLTKVSPQVDDIVKSLNMLGQQQAEHVKSVEAMRKAEEDYAEGRKLTAKAIIAFPLATPFILAAKTALVPDTRSSEESKRELATKMLRNHERKLELEEQAKEIVTPLKKKLEVELVAQGLGKLTASLASAITTAGIAASQTIAGALKSAGVDTTEKDYKLRNQQIAAEENLIRATYHLAENVERNSIALERQQIDRDSEKPGVDQAEIGRRRANLVSREAVLNMTPKAKQALARDASSRDSPTRLESAEKAQASGSFMSASIQQDIALAGVAGKYADSLAKKRVAEIEEILNKENKAADAKIKNYDDELARIKLKSEATGGYYNEVEAQETLRLNKLKQNAVYEKQQAIETANLSKIALDNPNDPANIIAAGEAKKRMAANAMANTTALKALDSTHVNEQIVGRRKLADMEMSQFNTRFKNEADLRSANLDRQAKEIEYFKAIEAVSAAQTIREQARVDLARQSITYSNQAQQAAADNYAKMAPLLDEQARALANGVEVSPATTTALNEQIASYTSIQNQLRLINELETTRIDNMAKHAELVALQREEMENMASLTATLGLAFGKAGAAVGAGLSAIVKLGQNETNFLKKKLELQKKIDKADDRDPEKAEMAIELGKIEKDNAIQKLNAMGEIAGQAKTMFGEHTAMYKTMAAIEKANHVAAMAMQAEKMAKTLMDLPKTMAGGIAELIKQGGFAGFAGAAALIAMIGSLVGSFGGAAAAIPAGMTAEDRQKVQGTGQSWENGQIVHDKNSGVFGDTEAKSQSIANALEIVSKNSFEDLRYTNEMVTLLTKISKSISVVAKAAYGVRGITTGSGLGTTEGTTGKFVLGWGTQINKEIIDSGLQLTGSFKDLVEGIDGSVKGFETLKTTTTKKSFFGLVSNSNNSVKTTEFDVSGTGVEEQMSAVFSNAQNMLEKVGLGVNKDVSAVIDAYQIKDKDKLISLKGLKGEDLEKELTSVLSSILDDVTSSVLPELKEFQKFGEGMLQTAIRVLDQFENVNLALTTIGHQKLDSGFDGLAIANALSEASGGMENFIESMKSFADNFLTEEERMSIKQTAVAEHMVGLDKNSSFTKFLAPAGLSSFSSVDTVDEFKNLVQSIDLTQDGAADLVASLLGVQQSFHDVASNGISASELAEQKNGLEIEYLKLTGKTLEATNRERQKELEKLDKSLHPLQMRIWYLETANGLENRINEMTLSASEKLVKTRKEEKEATEAVFHATLDYIYALEDLETAKQTLLKAYDKELTLTNKLVDNLDAVRLDSVERLAKARKEELDSVSDLYKPIVSYTHAMQDVATAKENLNKAYQQEKGVLTSLSKALRDSAKSLRDFRDSLLVGSLSPKTPKEVYDELKSQLGAAVTAASAVPTTDAERAAQADAVSKVQSLSTQFLEASKVYYASSSQYSADFEYVLSITETLADTLDAQATEAEKQLAAMEAIAEKIGIGNEQTLTIAEATAALAAAEKAAYPLKDASDKAEETARAQLAEAESILKEVELIPPALIDLTTALSEYKLADETADALQNASTLAIAANIETYMAAFTQDVTTAFGTYTDAVLAVLARPPAPPPIVNVIVPPPVTASSDTGAAAPTPAPYVPDMGNWSPGDYGAAAVGGYRNSPTLVGELGPEIVDFSTPGRVYTAEQTKGMFAPANDSNLGVSISRLATEVVELRKEVAKLREEQKEQTGHLITSNYDANMKAAEKITDATESTANEIAWQKRSAVKLA